MARPGRGVENECESRAATADNDHGAAYAPRRSLGYAACVATARSITRMSEAEYLASEPRVRLKREWRNGEVVAMAGGTPEHALVVAKVGAALTTALRGQRCQVFSSELRVHTPRTGLYAYPDATIVRGPIERHTDGISVLNPSLLVEVLSDSTETYDRGEKLASYESIGTLTDYVLVATERQGIEHFRRTGASQWVVTRYLPSAQTVPIPSLAIALSFDDVYDGWAAVAATRVPKGKPARPPPRRVKR